MGRSKHNSKATNVIGSSTIRKTGAIAKRPKVNMMRKFLATVPGERNLKIGGNIFDRLSVDSGHETTKQPTTNKLNRPPPLIVTGNSGNIKEQLTTIGISKYSLKVMSIGIKNFLENDDDFNKVNSILKDKEVEFFTHSTKGAKALKVVLSGLPNIPIETLKEELALLNITPKDIFLMSTRNPNPHRALYLVHLNNNEITLNDLSKIKTVCHTIVKWNKYIPNSRGPTQCRNCCMYGHGTQNCYRKPTCSLCASNAHNQTNCPLKNMDKDTTPIYKCSYCINNNITPVNHRASDASCPGRSIYTESRKRSTMLQRNIKPTETKFRTSDKKVYVDAPIPPPLTQTFSSVITGATGHATRDENDTSSHPNDSLFSTADLLQIFTSAINRIKNCRTKLDQIQVIADLISHAI